MYVTRVEDASVMREDVGAPPVSRRRSGGMGWIAQLIILAAIAATAYHFWPQVMALVGKK